MSQQARLQSARHWLGQFEGKSVVRGYARWFAVDLMCAVKELEMLGVPLDQDYVEKLRVTCSNRPRRAAKPTQAEPLDDCLESDELFSFIAGYTPGGAPYGVPREPLSSDAESDWF
jgi:hypothetical protein